MGVAPVALCAAQMLLQLVASAAPSRGASPANSPVKNPNRTLLSAARAQQLVASSGAVQNLVAVLAANLAEGGGESALTLAALRALRQLSRHPPNAVQVRM